ncbi:SRPBCC domain-containing protein [Leifsonia aquatica]|uniref:SRPBCC domain-containing protein n=1 Tax=Leifsonia aquatica TaxID=144185 RepID=UPI00384D5903
MTTDNAAAIADTDTLTVRRAICIAAPREKAWEALTDPAHISRWFGATTLDPAGARAIVFEGYGAVPLQLAQSDPQTSVTYRWNDHDALAERLPALDPERATTFTLADIPEGTELSVVESGFAITGDPAGNVRKHGEGWTQELDKLVALLEDGVALAESLA